MGNQGVSRAALPPEALGEILFLVSSSFLWPLAWACGWLIPISTSVVTFLLGRNWQAFFYQADYLTVLMRKFQTARQIG